MFFCCCVFFFFDLFAIGVPFIYTALQMLAAWGGAEHLYCIERSTTEVFLWLPRVEKCSTLGKMLHFLSQTLFLPSCAITAEKGRDKYHKDRIIPLVSVYPCLYQMTSSDCNIIDRENNALKNITFAMWHVHQESSHQLLLWIFCIIATEVFKNWKNSKVLTSQPRERFIIVCVHKCLCLDVFTKYILLENT